MNGFGKVSILNRCKNRCERFQKNLGVEGVWAVSAGGEFN